MAPVEAAVAAVLAAFNPVRAAPAPPGSSCNLILPPIPQISPGGGAQYEALQRVQEQPAPPRYSPGFTACLLVISASDDCAHVALRDALYELHDAALDFIVYADLAAARAPAVDQFCGSASGRCGQEGVGASPPAAGHVAASSATRPMAAASAGIASALTAAGAADAAAGPTPMLNATTAGLCSRKGAVAVGPVATASSVCAAAEPAERAATATAVLRNNGFATALANGFTNALGFANAPADDFANALAAVCSAPGSAGDALAAPTATQIRAVTVLSGATAGSALVLTDGSAGLSGHEGVVAGASAASAGFRASVSDAPPPPVCSAAGSASGSTGSAPLLFGIEALSLLEGATLGAVRLVSVAVQTAVQAAAPSAVRAAAADIEKLSLLEGAEPAPFRSAAGSASGSAGDAPPLREVEQLSLLEGAMIGAARLVPEAVRINCSAGRAATSAAVLRSDGSTNALAAFAAIEEGVVVGVAAAAAGFEASTTLNGAAPTLFCAAPGSASALAAPTATQIVAVTVQAANIASSGAVGASAPRPTSSHFSLSSSTSRQLLSTAPKKVQASSAACSAGRSARRQARRTAR